MLIKNDRKKLGNLAESIVTKYLANRSYKILGRNYTKPWGEIDIIVKEGELIVFVEVKANRKEYGSVFAPELRVNRKKLDKILKTAMLYMECEMRDLEAPWRIDVVAVTFNEKRKNCKLVHYKNVAESYM